MKDMDKYNEALERAKAAYGTGAYDDATLEFLFPQLCESEEETTRKELLDFVRSFWADHKDKLPQARRWVTYLEKQKEPRNYRKLYEEVVNSDWFKENYKGKSLGEEKQKPLTEEEYHKMSEELYKNHPWYMQKCIYGDTPSAERCKYCSASCKARVEEQKPIFKKGDKVIWDDEEFNILDVNVDSYNVGGYNLPFYRQNELSLVEQKPAELTPLATLLSNYLKNDFEYFAGKKWDETRWNETLNIQASELLRYAKKELEKDQKPINPCDASWDAYYSRGYQRGLEVGRKEQKPAEWSEEDEEMRVLAFRIVNGFKNGLRFIGDENNKEAEKVVDWLKSLRPQPREEIYQSAKHNLAIKFMNYLDENRPESKMSLSNAECEDIDKAFKEDDWEKIIRYANKYAWKPSEYHLSALLAIFNDPDNIGSQTCQLALTDLYEQLKKLM